MQERDIRTYGTIDKDELCTIQQLNVAIVGAGGLGGYVLEMIARLGVRRITVVDSETFDISNLNRQLLSSEQNIGDKKVDAARDRIGTVNSNIHVKTIAEKLSDDNVYSVLKDQDVVFDCVDNIEARFVIQDCCKQLGIPFIHGAVDGWYGQVSTVLPGDDTLDKIYSSNTDCMVKKQAASFIPAVVASYQVSEFVKLSNKKGSLLRNQLLYIDMFTNSQIIINLSTSVSERTTPNED